MGDRPTTFSPKKMFFLFHRGKKIKKISKNFRKFFVIFANFFFIFWINSFYFFFSAKLKKKKHSQKPIEVGAARGRGMMGPPESEDERNHSREGSLFKNGMCWVGKCFWGTGRVFFLVFILSTQIIKIKHPHRRGGRIRSVIKNNTISILVV